jgi:hypothetical protein
LELIFVGRQSIPYWLAAARSAGALIARLAAGAWRRLD